MFIKLQFLINLFLFSILELVSVHAQDNLKLTLSDIWEKRKYSVQSSASIKFSDDGKVYYEFEHDSLKNRFQIIEKSFANSITQVICTADNWVYQNDTIELEDFVVTADKKFLLMISNQSPIYRRSSEADYFLLNLTNNKILKLSEHGKISNVSFAPNFKLLAYTRNNNFYYFSIDQAKEYAISNDGKNGHIINASTDWVYEEEFEFTKAYEWSKDSKTLAYLRFDEKMVPEYNMQMWATNLYPSNYQYKYPKAGEKNAKVTAHIFDLDKNISSRVTLPNEHEDDYLPRLRSTAKNNEFAITRLNRAQNHLQIFHVSSLQTKQPKMVYEERDKAYVEINDNVVYLPNNKGFLLTSEKDGFRHWYHYSNDGKILQQISNGKWEVEKLVGYSATKNILYYTASKEDISQTHFYGYNLNKKLDFKITQAKGGHQIEMSPACEYYIDHYSRLDQLPETNLYHISGMKIRTLSNNTEVEQMLKKVKLISPQWLKFKNQSGTDLNGWILKPETKANTQTPALIYLYGGPGSQEAKDEWMGANYLWFQYLAEQGYAVFVFDGRGTGARGADFKKSTQGQLGKLETEDLISAAQYLASLGDIDPSRIGVFGWSFGGYMASLAMTKGADFFKLGIAVAPVTSWRFYDTIYTERFLGTPNENKSGYDDNSPINYAHKLKGKFLLVHGTADDNVHIQNAIEFERALIKAGKQFQSFHYPDKNHGIYGGNTRMHLYQMMTDFILNNL